MGEKFEIDKEKNFSEWFNEVCSETGANLMDKRYGVRGFYVHTPPTVKIVREIYRMLEEEVEADGHEPLLFPTLIPEDNLRREKEHVEGFAPEVFWITDVGEKSLEERYALRPTGETAFYPMYSIWIRSYRDLPFKRYQSRISVYRNEKTSKPFLRGREFLFFETHDVFESEEAALDQVNKDRKITEKIVYERLGIPFIYFRRPQWDKFAGAKDTYAADSMMPDGRANQIASTHNLGQGFANAFQITYEDEEGKEKYPWQTCFGPGIWRIVAALISIHGDRNGLVLPFEVAPVQIVIVPIVFQDREEENNEVLEKAGDVYEKLEEDGFRVIFDESDKSPGEKFNKWDLKGVPVRIEIGPEEVEKGSLTLVKRNSSQKIEAEEDSILDRIERLSDEILAELKEDAEERMRDGIVEVKEYSKAVEKIKEGKMVKAPFCSIDLEGEGCAEKIKEDASGKVRGTEMNSSEGPEGRECIVCGKKAKETVYISREY